MSDRSSHVPVHVGIILDGNRRWAKAQGKPTLEGHQEGAETFRRIALHAFDQGVKYDSAYVFSTENWQRTQEEVSYLMKLLVKAVEKHLETFHKANIKIVVLGSKENLTPHITEVLQKSEEQTARNTRGTLALCFNYGGKQEIVDAVKKLIQDDKTTDITADAIKQNIYHPEIPSIDLLIRTSGEHRTSGFMLWRADYAELYFTDTLWPDFTERDFNEALDDYSERQRRFGK